MKARGILSTIEFFFGNTGRSHKNYMKLFALTVPHNSLTRTITTISFMKLPLNRFFQL